MHFLFFKNSYSFIVFLFSICICPLPPVLAALRQRSPFYSIFEQTPAKSTWPWLELLKIQQYMLYQQEINAALIPFTKLNNMFLKSQVIRFCWFTTGNLASKIQRNIFWLLRCCSKHHLQCPYIYKLFSRGRFTLALAHIYNGPLIIIVNNTQRLTNSAARAIPVKSAGCAPDLGLFQTLSTCWLHSCHIL